MLIFCLLFSSSETVIKKMAGPSSLEFFLKAYIEIKKKCQLPVDTQTRSSNIIPGTLLKTSNRTKHST